MTTQNLILETDEYNERRYGKPWIAKIDFTSNPNGEFLWGQWIGELGGKGLLKLDNLRSGDIVAKGQRDNRKFKNSAPEYYIFLEGGKLKPISKKDAYLHQMSISNVG